MDVFYPVQYGDIFDADFGEYYEFFTGRLDVPLKSYDFICDNVEIVRNLIDSVYKSFENDGLGSPAPKYLPKFLKQCTEILNLEQNELKNYKDIYNPIRREIYCENLKRKESKLKKLEEDRLNLEKIEIEALDEILKFFNIDENKKREVKDLILKDKNLNVKDLELQVLEKVLCVSNFDYGERDKRIKI